MPMEDVISVIDKEIELLVAAKKLLEGSKTKGRSTVATGRGHTMSAAARKKISLTQKLRWAERNKKTK